MQEITELKERLDVVLDNSESIDHTRLRGDRDYIYCLDVRGVLDWLNKQILDPKDVKKTEEFMEKLLREDMEEKSDEDIQNRFEFLNKELIGDLGNRNYFDLSYNVCDIFSWALLEESTEDFVSENFMNLERLQRKMTGQEPTTVASTKTADGLVLRDLSDDERENLFEIIDEIAGIRESLQELKEERRDLHSEMNLIQARQMSDIASAKDEKGKRKYPNKEARRAELSLKLRNDEEYQKLSHESKSLHRRESRLEIKHDTLVDKKAILTGVIFDREKINWY